MFECAKSKSRDGGSIGGAWGADDYVVHVSPK